MSAGRITTEEDEWEGSRGRVVGVFVVRWEERRARVRRGSRADNDARLPVGVAPAVQSV